MASPLDPSAGTAPPSRPEPAAPEPVAAVQPGAPIPPEPSSDWPKQATDAIVDLVDQVRDRTTGTVLTIARAIVFGVIVAVLAGIIFVLALIGSVRLVNEALMNAFPWADVWLTYLLFGVVFLAAGTVVFRRRQAPTA
jgi:hypothetical protein